MIGKALTKPVFRKRRRRNTRFRTCVFRVDGDRDPTSAGTVGDAVVRVGSRAAAGMPANPDEARQVGQHIADRGAFDARMLRC